jgi:hypothetical protein
MIPYSVEEFLTYDDRDVGKAVQRSDGRAKIKNIIQDSWDLSELKEIKRKLWGHGVPELHDFASRHTERAEVLEDGYEPSFSISEDDEPDDWEGLFKLDDGELKKMAVHYNTRNPKEDRLYRVCKAVLYYKNEDPDYIQEAFSLDERGGSHLDLEKQKKFLHKSFSKLDKIVVLKIFFNLEKITTNKTESNNSNGSAKSNGSWLNLISESQAGGVSTTAHEVGHAIHYAFGVHCNSSIDNRESDTESKSIIQ